jgi:hypothetical protein
VGEKACEVIASAVNDILDLPEEPTRPDGSIRWSGNRWVAGHGETRIEMILGPAKGLGQNRTLTLRIGGATFDFDDYAGPVTPTGNGRLGAGGMVVLAQVIDMLANEVVRSRKGGA